MVAERLMVLKIYHLFALEISHNFFRFPNLGGCSNLARTAVLVKKGLELIC